MTRPLATLYLVIAMALVGANIPLGKALVAEMPIYAFTAFRFLVASAALALLASTEAGPRLRDMTGRERRDLVAMAALGMVGFTVFMLEGLRRTSASDAGIITATLPAVVAVLGGLAFGERWTRGRLVAVLCAVLGLLAVNAGAVLRGEGGMLGNMFVGAAVLCEASFVILAKRLSATYRPFRLALGANLVGLVLSAPLVLADGKSLPAGTITGALWAAAIWYVLAASVISLWFWYRALPHVEAWRAGVATAALPVAALAIAALVLGETIGPLRLAGAVLVVAGIAATALMPAERSLPERPA